MPIFLHANLLHLAFNIYGLQAVGPVIEEVYGRARFFVLYLACGILGSLPAVAWGLITRVTGVGASGALMGLVGAGIAIGTKRGGALNLMLRRSFLLSAALTLLSGLVMSRVDNLTHFGGLAVGLFLGFVMKDREPATRKERQRANVLAAAMVAVVLLSVAAMLSAASHAGHHAFG